MAKSSMLRQPVNVGNIKGGNEFSQVCIYANFEAKMNKILKYIKVKILLPTVTKCIFNFTFLINVLIKLISRGFSLRLETYGALLSIRLNLRVKS